MNLAQSIITRNLEKHALKAAVGFKKENQWKELSWKKFSEMIAKTANALKAAGIQENDSVAIYSDNSAEWITFDLAILSLGAITVPIYSTNNAEQAEYIINDSQSKIILAGNQEQYNTCYELLQRNEYLKTIVVAKNKVIGKKENTVFLREFIADQPSTFEFCPKEDDDTATLIYTSGTTGIPKGVMITHGNFRKEFDAHFEFFKFKNFEDELSLAFLPLTHVFERSWSLLSLYGGAKVYFLEDPKNIAHALIEVKPTMMCTVPRFFQKVYAGIHDVVEKSSPTKKKIFNWSLGIGKQYAELKRTEKEIPFGLKAKHGLADLLVFSKMKEKLGGRLWFTPCGGASISPEVTEFFDAIGLHLTVGYGLTETTATLSLFPFTNYKYGTCGKILPGVEIRIGAENEIQARGSGIMKGYFNKPEETKTVFTEDGWFKTGDAGNIDDQGNLTITERIKDLLKTSNGKYIAPQQVENILSNNNYIQQVMVVAEGRQFVSALIVPNFEFLKGELSKMNIPFTSWNEIVKNEAINKLYKTKIEEFQTALASFEKVKKFVLMPAEFEIGSGEITPTLKIKRKVVSEKYKDLIEQMYS
ncbi:long-chain fatty acid--CoA ligase [Elizabethkingia anophelis]|uniref:Long-chain-fatty-acid--CoA ligase FadD15 n=1 Tax=Elizabethkingia anophelis TaxID=1117645 RepID=A0A7Z7PY04_9FLAO|nr:long-chain fatty acid--CoA ligase [Elizabethkingia anophelis]MCT3630403.1 long-chain fatty acid--CoA ligase [Elizabethkingia anophelis]MCT3634088.1 long-chain fatty acid--CoA ligase [Elizabethkingia anophelis]MCT3692132.1 long-chain fatty acid--CoA ligase [Elizabethkingia anophelis]MCT3823598.1 long-chain fatty acid--CoA ligase [Elizabethkingia anophelis]MCT3830816.1 long-chain fatty acid--CoA ligase [Elizabethkingia anophelis]